MDVSSDLIGADVHAAFDAAADRYDVMVALSPGYHRHLSAAAESLIEQIRPRTWEATPLLDLGSGSGASTRALQRAAQRAGTAVSIIGVDAADGMLRQARAKRWPSSIRFVRGLAEQLSTKSRAWGIEPPVAGILAAYLLRNVPSAQRDRALRGFFEALEPGGPLVIHEYSVAGRRAAALRWTLACWLVVIPLSLITSRQTQLYRYLWRSVVDFDSVQAVVDRLYATGFVDVEIKTVSGWQHGILHTFRARKPGSVR